MVSLLIVSHSSALANGVRELAQEMAPEVKIGSVGGTSDGRLGNDYEQIYNALDNIYSNDGVVVLFDLGSSYLTTALVKEAFEIEGRDNIHIVDGALVEGAVVAAVEMSLGSSIDIVKGRLLSMKLNKI